MKIEIYGKEAFVNTIQNNAVKTGNLGKKRCLPI